MYSGKQKAKRMAILEKSGYTCYYCQLTAHQIEWADTVPDGAIPLCRDCMTLINATQFLKDAQPADRVDFLYHLRREKGVASANERFSKRPPGKKNYRFPPQKTRPQSRLREKLARKHGHVV